MNKIKTIDGLAVYIKPGTYELSSAVENKYISTGFWPYNTRFIVEKNSFQLSDMQTAYDYYTMRQIGKKRVLINSYETDKWNSLVTFFQPTINYDMDDFLYKIGGYMPSTILTELESIGKITRSDIEQIAINRLEKIFG